jgi:NodT family efflux transporter outer membrane factor (OMF) lipoprotein
MSRALVVVVVGACAVGPNFHRPRPPLAKRYTHGGVRGTIAAGGVAQVVKPGAELADEWWQLFGSKQIDAMVTETLAHNPSLEAERASLRRSEYLLRAGYGVFFPQLDANAGATRQRFTPSRFGATTPPSEFNLYTLGGSLSYVLDVFGGERRTIEGLRAQVDVQCFTLTAARLTLTANVVNTVIARAGYRAEIAATEELVKSLQQQVDIAEVQVKAGIANTTTLLALRAQLANTQALLPPLRQRQDQADNLLAALVGRTPAEVAPAELDLAKLVLPRDLPVSLPSHLVRQRPDILIAEATLHASSAQIGVATAAMLPSFNISGTLGFDSPKLRTLISQNSLFWSIGANLLAPLFHGGTLNNQRKAAIEAYRQSLASYHDTVLRALADVATSLQALQHDAEALEARLRALADATQSSQLTATSYQAGTAGYLDLLVANVQLRQAQITALEIQAQRLQDTVALFVALGGGWWSARRPVCAL